MLAPWTPRAAPPGHSPAMGGLGTAEVTRSKLWGCHDIWVPRLFVSSGWVIHSLLAPRSHQPLSDHLETSTAALGGTVLTNITLAALGVGGPAPKQVAQGSAEGKLSSPSHSWTPPVSWWQTTLRGLLCRQERERFLGGAFAGIVSL